MGKNHLYIQRQVFLISNEHFAKFKSHKILIAKIKNKDANVLKKNMLSPFNDDICIYSVENYIQFQSETKPIMAVYNQNEHSILYKNENIKNDQLVMNLVEICKNIINKESNLNISPIYYNVIPINEKEGILEIINQSKTLADLYNNNISILNFIFRDETKPIKEPRNNFTKSTAFYYVICYLFGIEDRHLNNIMIREDGNLFHIDFGWMFGKDPKNVDCSTRITESIVEAIGGYNSNNFENFKDMLKEMVKCLCKYYDFFMAYIDPTDEQKIELDKRFLHGDPKSGDILVEKINNQPYLQFLITDFAHSGSIQYKTYTDNIFTYIGNLGSFNNLKIW